METCRVRSLQTPAKIICTLAGRENILLAGPKVVELYQQGVAERISQSEISYWCSQYPSPGNGTAHTTPYGPSTARSY